MDLTTLSPKRILVCQLKQIGDVIISTAMMELLAKRYPDARIDILTEAKCAPVLENNPRLHQVWTTKGGTLLDEIRTYAAIRSANYDLVIDFQQLPRTRRAAMLSGAKVRLSYATKWYKRFAYTHFAPMKKGGYAGKYKAQVLAPLGIDWATQKPRMFVTEAETTWAREHLAKQGCTPDNTLITLDPTHWSDTRKWFPERYAETLNLMAEARPDMRFYLLNGPGEQATVQSIIDMCSVPERCMSIGDGKPSLRKAAAIISQAALHLGNCSAPRHMAAALDVPSLVVVGSNGNTAWAFPDPMHTYVDAKVHCRKCNRNTCPEGTLLCLKEIRATMVAESALKLVESTTNPN